MRYLSLFSGIEAASIAWEPLGWEPVAFCEIDEFPSAVLAHRWPHVPNLGDITEVDWSEFNERYGTVDVVVGGSPCQSFSVAGKREGLRGESGLMFEYIRAVREVRPRWFVWENVPGALSSEKGAAFGQLLTEMDGLGYGLAWRVLDAQFFGVAQRRRRVFLVGSLGSQRAAEVLFESDSLRWDHPSSREKRKDLTRAAQQRAAEGCGDGCLTPWDAQSKRVYSPDSCSPSLCSNNTGGSGSIQPTVLTPVSPCYAIAGNIIGRDDKNGGHQLGVVDANENGMFSLTTADKHAVCMASGQANAEIEYDLAPAQAARQYKDPPIICVADDNANAAIDDDLCGSLKVGGGSALRCVSSNGEDLVGALCARDFKGVGSQYVNEGKVIVQWTQTATS